jgi:glycosyltransferase involved in cell wall biosynthesis
MNQISLCMIVKNEESNLERCLKPIAPYMDEIIIVDTGSTDRTKEIALRYTDKVYDFIWINDFAAARNYSISKASHEYVLVLDADEYTQSIDVKAIKQVITENPFGIGRLLRVNEYTRNGNSYKFRERVNRLFSKKYYQYEGIIHEQVMPVIQAEGVHSKEDLQLEDDTYLIPLSIQHSGYEGDLEARKRKTERNIALLKKALEQSSEDPYILYQLGKSYYMKEDYLNACEYFGQALYFDLDPRLEYVQDMVESYGYSLLNSEQYDTAIQLINIYDEFGHSADFIFLIALILMNNGRFEEAIKEFLKAAGKSEAKMEGVNGYLAYYNIGVIFECLGDNRNARSYYSKCGNYEPGIQRLKALTEG